MQSHRALIVALTLTLISCAPRVSSLESPSSPVSDPPSPSPSLESGVSRLASPPPRPWTNYQVFMWTGDSVHKQPDKYPLFFSRLKQMGVTAGMVHNHSSLLPLIQNNFPFYLENLVNRGLCLKFNSSVTDWDKFVTSWSQAGRPQNLLTRDYSLDDPQWQSYATKEIQTLVTRAAPHHPLAYNLRDELSLTISANPFDYDFHPLTLAAFRSHLRSNYTSLHQLNAHWQTKFESWDVVVPFTTDQIKHRMASGQPLPQHQPDWSAVARTRFSLLSARQNLTRWNFAPWADFRSYMDSSLARELHRLRLVSRAIDPLTPVGIEGTQMPSAFGGYDLWKLAQALDWVEPYDIANAREILGSFMPTQTFLTTVFEKDPLLASRRLWHLLLQGDRGAIIWWSEDSLHLSSPDYPLTPKALALAPVLHHLQSPLAQLFLRASPLRDPIYIHYSQPSIQVAWLLESIPDGATWVRRFSSFEAAHNQHARIRNAWLKTLQNLGYNPQFISSQQIENDFLTTPRVREHALQPPSTPAILILPSSWAMSTSETRQIQSALRSGQLARLLFDSTPAIFDHTAKLLPRSPLEDLFPPSATNANPAPVLTSAGHQLHQHLHADISSLAAPAPYPPDPSPSTATDPTTPAQPAGQAAAITWLQNQLRSCPPPLHIPPAAHVRVHRFQSPRATLLALERNVHYHITEDLKQAGGNQPLEKPIQFLATLPRSTHIYNLITLQYLGYTNTIPCHLDPWQPLLFALSPSPLPTNSLIQHLSAPKP